MIPGRIVALGLAALLLGGAGIGVAATRDTSDDEARAPSAVDQADLTTTTTTDQPTTTSVAPSTTQVSPTTTTGRGTSTTVARASTTSTTRRATTTTTPPADCTREQLEVTATTDKRTYAPTEQVRLESTLRNRSSATCFYAGYTFQAVFSDPGGRRIVEVNVPGEGSTRSQLVPGAVLTGTVPWDQRVCQQQPCPLLSPGTYSATARWVFVGGPFEARVTFTLT